MVDNDDYTRFDRHQLYYSKYDVAFTAFTRDSLVNTKDSALFVAVDFSSGNQATIAHSEH